MLSQQIPWTSEPCTRRLHDHKLLSPDNYQSSQIDNPTAKQCRKRGLKKRFSRAGTLTRESIQPLLCAWSIRGRFEISNQSVSGPSLSFFFSEGVDLPVPLPSLAPSWLASSRFFLYFFFFVVVAMTNYPFWGFWFSPPRWFCPAGVRLSTFLSIICMQCVKKIKVLKNNTHVNEKNSLKILSTRKLLPVIYTYFFIKAKIHLTGW